MSEFDRLKPCPFCGGGETLIEAGPTICAGMRSSEPSTYSIKHWCETIKGQPSIIIERIGRDKQSAIDMWNTRAHNDAAVIAELQAENEALRSSVYQAVSIMSRHSVDYKKVLTVLNTAIKGGE